MRLPTYLAVIGAFLTLAGGCALPWDDYDPRLAPDGAGPGAGGAFATGGAGSTGAAPGTGGDAGAMQSGGGGTGGECNGESDGTVCGSTVVSDCDSRDTCVAGVCQTNHEADGTSCDDCGGGFCNVCVAGACPDCAVSPGELPTVFSNTSAADGLMFNVAALEKLKITGLSLNLRDGFSGPIEVYTRPGGHIGHEEDATQWTLVFQTDVTSAGANAPTFMSMAGNDIEMASGETLGLYVTSIASGQNDQLYRTQGAAAGETAIGDTSLVIKYGNRLQYPFTLQTAVKLWNGTVHYDLCN